MRLENTQFFIDLYIMFLAVFAPYQSDKHVWQFRLEMLFSSGDT